MIPFPKDFQDFLKLLDKHEVRCLIVGGYALGFHGYVRATGDLDIFVEVSEENAEKLVAVFLEFGFASGVEKALFLDKGKMVRIGRPPLRLELLTEISGVSFAEAYASSQSIAISDFHIRFIDYYHLIKNKDAAGRPKDKADIEELKRCHHR